MFELAWSILAIGCSSGVDRTASMSLYAESAAKAAEDVRAYLAHTNTQLPLFSNRLNSSTDNAPRICVGIQSARRVGTEVNYLEQAVLSLLTRMNVPARKADVYIHVFNVDAEPELHSQADSVRDLVPVTALNRSSSDVWEFATNPKLRESADHAEILRSLYRAGCAYSVLLEDDALATEGWLDHVERAIAQVEARDPEWYTVKLFVARKPGEQPADGVTDFDHGFGTVAFLVRRGAMLDFAKELDFSVRRAAIVKEVLPKDMCLLDYALRRDLVLRSYEPSVFQHTGVFSSVNPGRTRSDFNSDWSMIAESFPSQGVPVRFDPTIWGVNPKQTILA